MASNTGAGETHQCSGQDDGGVGTPPVKRARLIQPDVTVVVGGTEFHHFSQMLCSVSDYFDAALNSGIPTNRLEFPDKDPAEWEMLLPLFSIDPSTSHFEVAADNVEKIAEWALLLGIDWLHEKCDKIYSTKNISRSKRMYRHQDARRQQDAYRGRNAYRNFNPDKATCPLSHSGECEMDEHGVVKCLGMEMADEHASAAKAELESMIETLQRSIALGMSASKNGAAKHVRHMITEFPEVLDQPMIALLVSAIKGDIDTIQEVWASLKPFIPDTLKETDPPSLCCNAIFPDVFFAQLTQTIKNRQAVRVWEKKIQRKEWKLDNLKRDVLDLPHNLYKWLPRKRRVPGQYNSKEKFNEIGRNMLRRVIADDLGYMVDIPEDWDRSYMDDEYFDSDAE